MSNHTAVSVFILRGFSDVPELQLLTVAAFVIIYVISVLGNTSSAAVTLDARLHTPMYFFLKHLSLVDICSVSTTLPQALLATIMGSGEISFPACASQLFAFICLGSTECFLITSMAYDRCLAIYRPLEYRTIMSPETCVSLVAVAWASGLVFSSFHTANTFSLPFCGPNVIDHFFCDIPPLMRLACANTVAHEVIGFAVSGCVIMSCFTLTILSYVRILATILQIRSEASRWKAFSTCTSHLMTVLLFYGTGSSAYLQPTTRYSPLRGRLAAVFYSILTPSLNPLIYSLRNKDMKAALRKLYLQEVLLRRSMTNHSAVSVFLLQGFSSDPELQLLSVVTFFFIYVASVLGNISIVAAVTLDTRLHTPMYFFLKHLSLVDICSLSTTLPRALLATMVGSGEISLPACASQLFSFICLVSTECFLITSMAYDRCLAIYRPLVYRVIMNAETCVSLVVVAWASGLLYAAFHTANTFTLPFCGPNVIDHFFCDIPPLMHLACANADSHEAIGFAVGGCVIMSCFVLIILSYVRILTTVLQIRSEASRRKAFSTCSSHLATVLLFYVTGSSAYMRPAAGYSPLQGRLAAVFYSILTPSLNPLIYSLRNKDMKAALQKLYLQVPS
ncbi:LOW QUALITY PROTEIN: olfactory receptor 14J1-like [Rhynchocyon petersi]